MEDSRKPHAKDNDNDSRTQRVSAGSEWQWMDAQGKYERVQDKQNESDSQKIDRIMRAADRIRQTPVARPPPRQINFQLPPPAATLFTLIGMALLLYFAHGPSTGALVDWIYWVVPRWLFQYSVKALAAIHLVESLLMFLACRSLRRHGDLLELPWFTVILYTASTLVLGVFSALALSRQVRQTPKKNN